ncbi:MAG: hypothetical protein KBT19_09565 [Lachnospiraceae bacterium]|nr:hypothetical protein [Candidatus Colinaster equi]
MKEKMNKISKWYCSNVPNKVEIVLAFVAFGLIFFNMYYQDNPVIFLNYYWSNEGLLHISSGSSLALSSMAYGIVQDIIGCIWVLPVNIVHLFAEIEPGNVICMLYYKACIMIFVVLTVKEWKKTAGKLGIADDNIRWMIYVGLTSIFMALPLFHIAQTDAIYLWFFLKAYNAYLDGDHKHFILWSILAIDVKYIILFAFIPLELLVEKRILYILRDCVVGCILIPVQIIVRKLINAIYVSVSACVPMRMWDVASAAETSVEGGSTQTDFMMHFFNKMLYFEIPAIRKSYMASVLVVLFILLCIWCYLLKRSDDYKDVSIYVCVVSLGLFFSLSSPSPYWIVVMYPFVFLLIYKNAGKFRINTILQLLYSFMMLLIYMDDQGHVYGGAVSFNQLPLTEWFHIVPQGHTFEYGPQVYDYLAKTGIFGFMSVITAICLAAAVAFVIINFPKSKVMLGVEDGINDEERLHINHRLLTGQAIFLLVWFVINVYCVSRY